MKTGGLVFGLLILVERCVGGVGETADPYYQQLHFQNDCHADAAFGEELWRLDDVRFGPAEIFSWSVSVGDAEDCDPAASRHNLYLHGVYKLLEGRKVAMLPLARAGEITARTLQYSRSPDTLPAADELICGAPWPPEGIIDVLEKKCRLPGMAASAVIYNPFFVIWEEISPRKRYIGFNLPGATGVPADYRRDADGVYAEFSLRAGD